MGGYRDTIIIGGGQAGLATSYHLMQRSREHIILEQAAQPGCAWRNGRWDSFTLVTPNWSFRLPGAWYDGGAPDGFMPRDEVIARLEAYVERFALPIAYGVRVTSVELNKQGDGYLVRTGDSLMTARNVVVATGYFQAPKIPSFSAELPTTITQMHSGAYRNPESLPAGEVLVVGSGQSGSQIAEELYLSGRKVYLSVGGSGRGPRRYRGKDIFEWLHLTGLLDRTVDQLPSPKARFVGSTQATGRDGGRTLNLHRFARDGVVLLGHLQSARGNWVRFASDLKDSLAATDRSEIELVEFIDRYIAEAGLDAPLEQLPTLRDGYEAEDITELDLKAAGIATIIWAAGYRFDFSLVKLPILDDDGLPIQKRGVTKSGLLFGVGEDAEAIASVIAAREQ
ncbi:MAG: NAD(P)-binding domain-containing protein [Anaerolineae bacterium]|nr:NAD(P)-binding domain-containing protein [Anaerolineae bacterium]